MNADLFGITQDPSGNLYLVTKLATLSLGYTKAPFDRNINVPFTPSEISIQRTVIENLEGVLLASNDSYIILISKGGGFIKLQLILMIKKVEQIGVG